MNPEAAIGAAATWTAGVAAVYLVVSLGVRLAVRHPGMRRALVAGALVAITGSGVAAAAPGDGRARHAPAVSADWPGAVRRARPSLVVVRPGDCLWDIAGQHVLRPTAARIASSWPRWWQRNRRLIGLDPDVIHPGQRLRPPDLRSST